jgi:hypothetical protein
MTPLIVFGLLGVAVFGMCVGAAISREYGRPFHDRARRAEAALQQHLAEQADREQHADRVAPVPLVTGHALQQPTPVVVHVHIPALYPPWPQPPVIDAQPFPALFRGDQ